MSLLLFPLASSLPSLGLGQFCTMCSCASGALRASLPIIPARLLRSTALSLDSPARDSPPGLDLVRALRALLAIVPPRLPRWPRLIATHRLASNLFADYDSAGRWHAVLFNLYRALDLPFRGQHFPFTATTAPPMPHAIALELTAMWHRYPSPAP
ncbi:hypothetical protein C8Q76DRAFT_790486 [Earliella scabrosa]|nr:hypothetical protein C8Q76DRAFT_790486 [Earliella scabrosa]